MAVQSGGAETPAHLGSPQCYTAQSCSTGGHTRTSCWPPVWPRSSAGHTGVLHSLSLLQTSRAALHGTTQGVSVGTTSSDAGPVATGRVPSLASTCSLVFPRWSTDDRQREDGQRLLQCGHHHSRWGEGAGTERAQGSGMVPCTATALLGLAAYLSKIILVCS